MQEALPDEPLIRSAANPLIKRMRALAQRKQREAEDAFVVEGIRPVWQAVESGVTVEALIVAPDLLTSEQARLMVAARRNAGMRVVAVSAAVYQSFAEREHPSGLAAIVRIVRRRLAELAVSPRALFVALHETGNPGNLGTILRTMDAVAANGLIVIGAATDPYHPTAVKASMGALFTIPIVRVASADEVLAWCRAHAIGVVTTSAEAREDHWSARYPRPCLLLFGSEGQGLPHGILEAGDLTVRIPMQGHVDSLNLAVSAGILLYEARRATHGA
jgi:TrmH family RNA methyltransferase